jgi:hypothetical protein
VILFLLAFIFLWACGATWLQAVEGEVSQDFASLPSAAWSLGSTVLAHFGLPTDPAVPTTSNGQNVMKIFSWIGVLLVGSLILPPLKSLMGTLGLKLENWRTPPTQGYTAETTEGCIMSSFGPQVNFPNRHRVSGAGIRLYCLHAQTIAQA